MTALLGLYIFARSQPHSLARALLLCAVTIGAGLVMVAKQPSAYYLLPEMAFVCLGITIVAFLALRNARIPVWARAGAFAFLIAVLGAQAFRYEYRQAQVAATEEAIHSAMLKRAAQRNCLTIFIYAVNETQFDLYFGNVSSGRRYSDRLARLYPDFMTYNTAAGKFETFNTDLSKEAATRRFSRGKMRRHTGHATERLVWNSRQFAESRRTRIHGLSLFLCAQLSRRQAEKFRMTVGRLQTHRRDRLPPGVSRSPNTCKSARWRPKFTAQALMSGDAQTR